jgi:formate dehydrogenase iron-sulfur subunit
MYVLHHADQPTLYHGLRENPISAMVGLWKGLTKPLALAGMAATALAGWFHYSRVGPNEVSKKRKPKQSRKPTHQGGSKMSSQP